MFKRGLGHIEVVLAFVLFIGFLVFGLYFFNPLDSTRVLDSSLFYAQDAIYKNVSSELVTYSVVLRNVPSNQNVALQLDKSSADGSGVYVEDLDGKKLGNSYDASILSVDRTSSESDFLTVRFGDFPYQPTQVSNTQSLTSDDFSISSSERREIGSEQRLDALNATYYADYEKLKKEFNLPGRVDFSFSVVFSNNDGIYASRPITEGLEVISKKERKEIVRKDGTIGFADVIVRVW